MATIYIDNLPYTVPGGQNLLEACLSLGFDIPYFCWHPAMHSIGACRQCAVKLFKNESDKDGKIVMSCMTPVHDGMYISIDNAEVRKFRAGIIELMMTYHPHDCPVCDEGGECHLQDMTVMTGHAYRRYRFTKRTHYNQYLGPLVNHEMNRCIVCYRCVRFYKDYAGGRDLDVFQCHNFVYFGRQKDGCLENGLSGNLVEVCPTGVFTDKTLKKHYTRKWDLQTAPSVCTHCSLGCNIIAGERYGILRRILNRYNPEINGYFICDRGRFGYEYVNNSSRIRHSAIQNASGFKPLDREIALGKASKMIREGKVVGIGSPRASLEANYVLKTIVGSERFYAGVNATDYNIVNSILSIMHSDFSTAVALGQVKHCDTVLILGEDLTNSAPMLAYEVRQAVYNKKLSIAKPLKIESWDDSAVREIAQKSLNPLIVINPFPTELDRIASHTFRLTQNNIARLGFAIAHELNTSNLVPEDLSDEERFASRQIAELLQTASSPLIISGCSSGNQSIIEAAEVISRTLGSKCRLSYVFPSCNSVGLALMQPHSIDKLLIGDTESSATLIVLEADLERFMSGQQINELLSHFKNLIVLDSLESSTTRMAHLLLPVSTFAESDGTFVNNEGRAQRFYKAFVPDNEIQESWRWLRNIRQTVDDRAPGWETLDDIIDDLSGSASDFANVRNAAPQATYRVHSQRIPREPHRFSGRTAMTPTTASPELDPDSFFAYSMEGYHGRSVPDGLGPRYWAPGWNSVQALKKIQSADSGESKEHIFTGAKLIEPSGKAPDKAPVAPPAKFERRKNELFITPVIHLFGSEELSSHADTMSELVVKPYVLMHINDALVYNVAEGDMCLITIKDSEPIKVSVSLTDNIEQGTAFIPAGISRCKSLHYPQWATIAKENANV